MLGGDAGRSTGASPVPVVLLDAVPCRSRADIFARSTAEQTTVHKSSRFRTISADGQRMPSLELSAVPLNVDLKL